MQKIETDNEVHTKRLSILLLLSITVHALTLMFLNYNATKLPALTSSQTGTSFSVKLLERKTSIINKNHEHNVNTTIAHKPIKKTQSKQTNKINPHSEFSNNNIANITPDKISNKPSSAHVIASINQQLDKYFYYPSIARNKNWQGKVLLTFNITSNGKLRNINIRESSGYRILDSAAVKALKKLNKVASNFQWPNTGMQINLPVIYKLTNG